MKVIKDVAEMQSLSSAWIRAGKKISFVPTMGNLHDGHISLIKKARETAAKVVVSIFVNPLQFDNNNDYDTYPRTINNDLEILSRNEVDIVFIPDEKGLYPSGRENLTVVEVQKITNELEGEHRPGHFCGVTTVVNKFFNIVQPTVAVFGEKDFQQLLIIERMVYDLNMPVHIVSMPTLREADGLAMSSRNHRLSKQERQLAVKLYEILKQTREKIMSGGTTIAVLENQAMDSLAQLGFSPEYFTIRSCLDLSQPKAGEPLVILAAAWLGATRLIDNIRI